MKNKKNEIKIINGHRVTVIKEPSSEPYEDIPEDVKLDWSQAKLNPYIKNNEKK